MLGSSRRFPGTCLCRTALDEPRAPCPAPGGRGGTENLDRSECTVVRRSIKTIFGINFTLLMGMAVFGSGVVGAAPLLQKVNQKVNFGENAKGWNVYIHNDSVNYRDINFKPPKERILAPTIDAFGQALSRQERPTIGDHLSRRCTA